MERDASGLASRSLSTGHSLHSKWGGKGKKPTAESQTEVHPEDAAKAWKSSEMCSQDTRFEIECLTRLSGGGTAKGQGSCESCFPASNDSCPRLSRNPSKCCLVLHLRLLTLKTLIIAVLTAWNKQEITRSANFLSLFGLLSDRGQYAKPRRGASGKRLEMKLEAGNNAIGAPGCTCAILCSSMV